MLTNTPSLLKSVTQPELIQFKIEYRVYEEHVAEINRSCDAPRRIEPASTGSCCSPILFQTLCILGQIEEAATPEEAADGIVRSWFDVRLASEPQDMTEKSRSAVDSVQYQQCRREPVGVCLKFVLDLVSTLDRNEPLKSSKIKKCKSLFQNWWRSYSWQSCASGLEMRASVEETVRSLIMHFSSPGQVPLPSMRPMAS